MLARYDAIYRLLLVMKPGKPLDELTVFDFGCGAGQLIRYLNRQGVGRKYYGIDGYGPNIDDFIPTPGAEAFHLYWDGTSELPFDADEIDIIVQCGAFSAMTPDVRALMFMELLRMPQQAFLGTFIQPSLAATPSTGISVCSPGDVLPLIDNTRYQTIMLSDYVPWDFALGAYRVPEYELQIA